MVSKRERVLLSVLLLTLLLCSAGVGLLLYRQRMDHVKAQIESYREQTRRMRASLSEEQGALRDQVQRLSVQVQEAERRFFSEGETDLYRFGLSVRALIDRYGLQVKTYRSLTEASALEYSISGDTLAFFRFLKALCGGEKLLRIDHLSMKTTGGSGIDVVLRIGYEETTVSPR